MRERGFGTLVTMVLAALAHIRFLADVWHRVAPAWVAVGATVAPVVGVLLGASLDAEARSPRWRAAGRAMELAGALLALLFDLVVIAMVVAGLAPPDWPVFLAIALVGAPAALAVARDYALGPPPPRPARRVVRPAPGAAGSPWWPALVSLLFVAVGVALLVRGARPRDQLMHLSCVAFFGLCATTPLFGGANDAVLRTVPRWDRGASRGRRAARSALSGVFLAVGVLLAARALIDPRAPAAHRGYALTVAAIELLAALAAIRPLTARERGVRRFHAAFEGLVARDAHGLTVYPWDQIRGVDAAEVGPYPVVRVALAGDATRIGQARFRPGATARQRARWTAQRARRRAPLGGRRGLTIGEGQCDGSLEAALAQVQRGIGDAAARVAMPTVDQYMRRFFGADPAARSRGPYRG